MTSVEEAFAEAPDRNGVETPAEATSVGEETLAETTTVDEAPVGTATADEAPVGTATADEAPVGTATADEAPVGTATADEALTGQTPVGDEGATLLGETAAAAEAVPPRYEGEGVYVGTEPPEGFTIKGNERSMKYHVPESAGYNRTLAEVWFNSEEAAQNAGFVRAQR
jgi:hypothetical protein